MAYNNDYVDGWWGLFRHVGGMRLVTLKASLAIVDLPASPIEPTCKACPAFHIKGMCNTWCRNASDNVPHTTYPSEDGLSGQCQRLWRPLRQSPRKSAGEQNVCSL